MVIKAMLAILASDAMLLKCGAAQTCNRQAVSFNNHEVQAHLSQLTRQGAPLQFRPRKPLLASFNHLADSVAATWHRWHQAGS